MSIRICPECFFKTDKAVCLSCGKQTLVSSKIKRFPRLPTEQDRLNAVMRGEIEAKCREFGCKGELVSVKTGPIVSQFNFRPDHFTRLRVLKSLNEDIALALSVDNVAINRVPGHSAVAIMVPNKVRELVLWKKTLSSIQKVHKDMALPLNLGIDSLGHPILIDLADAPHVLVAGSTGSGKSVLAKAIVSTLLYFRTSEELELVLVDPKQVELFQFRHFPHVKREPVSSVHGTLEVLEVLEEEMRKRMSFIYAMKCENLKQLNEVRRSRNEKVLPYKVVVIDEIADLVIARKKEISDRLATLSSVARASGIHIIAMTQRPSVDVIPGKIKVNFPVRIAFNVPSAADSKCVITQGGAEQLMKKGDAYALGVVPGLIRIHTPLITKEEIKELLDISLKFGHIQRAPVDSTKEELDNLLQDIKDVSEQKLPSEQPRQIETKSIAEMLEQPKKEGGYIQ